MLWYVAKLPGDTFQEIVAAADFPDNQVFYYAEVGTWSVHGRLDLAGGQRNLKVGALRTPISRLGFCIHNIYIYILMGIMIINQQT